MKSLLTYLRIVYKTDSFISCSVGKIVIIHGTVKGSVLSFQGEVHVMQYLMMRVNCLSYAG